MVDVVSEFVVVLMLCIVVVIPKVVDVVVLFVVNDVVVTKLVELTSIFVTAVTPNKIEK